MIDVYHAMTTANLRAYPILSIILRTLVFLLIWWMLTNGNSASWWIGVPAVVIAVITSHYLMPAINVNWFELFKFSPYFIIRSLVGGIDVARRAFHPELPIVPALIEYPLRLPRGLPQVCFINTVSLLPGTLIADSHEYTLKVHVLDETSGFIDEIRFVEQRIARIFSATLDESDQGIGENNESV